MSRATRAGGSRGGGTPQGERLQNSPTYPRIVEIVTGSGITQAELGEAVGASLRTVQNWARGDATPKGVKVTRLLDLSYLVEQLQAAYTEEGIGIWLHSRNRNLGGSRPIDLIVGGQLDEVLEEAERVAGAM